MCDIQKTNIGHIWFQMSIDTWRVLKRKSCRPSTSKGNTKHIRQMFLQSQVNHKPSVLNSNETMLFVQILQILTNYMERQPWEAFITQLVKKLSTFYGNWRLITMYIRAQTLLQVYFKYIFINPTSFMGIPNSITPMNNTSILTKGQASLKPINNWCMFYCNPFSFSKIWLVNLLCQNPQWWSQ